MACERGHVWSPPYEGYTPAHGHRCDCGETRYVLPPRPADLELWDVARAGLRCERSGCRIGAGEPYRLVDVAKLRKPYCAACATRATGESPPDTLPVRRTSAALRPPSTPLPDVAPMTTLNRSAMAARVREVLGEPKEEWWQR